MSSGKITIDNIPTLGNRIKFLDTATGANNLLEFTTADEGKLVVEGKTAAVNQDLTSDASPTFVTVTATTNVVGVAGIFSGAVSGTTATFTGDLIAVGGAFSGAVSGTTGTFTDDVGGVAGIFTGAVSGTTGTFTSTVSGTIGTFTGGVVRGSSISNVKEVTVAISNAELQALAGAPKELVAAPGASKYIEFLEGILVLNFVATAMDDAAGDRNLEIVEETSGTVMSLTVEADGFVDAAATVVSTVKPLATDVVLTANKGILLDNDGAEFTVVGGGDATMTAIIKYRILDLS